MIERFGLGRFDRLDAVLRTRKMSLTGSIRVQSVRLVVVRPKRVVLLVMVDMPASPVRQYSLRIISGLDWRASDSRHVIVLESRVERRSLEMVFAVVMARIAFALVNVGEVLAFGVGPVLRLEEAVGDLDVDHLRDARGPAEHRSAVRDGNDRYWTSMPVAAQGTCPNDDRTAEQDEVYDFGGAFSAQVGKDETEECDGLFR